MTPQPTILILRCRVIGLATPVTNGRPETLLSEVAEMFVGFEDGEQARVIAENNARLLAEELSRLRARIETTLPDPKDAGAS